MLCLSGRRGSLRFGRWAAAGSDGSLDPADRARAEAILLEAARLHATEADAMALEKKHELQERFGVEPVELNPRVYYRITDNWLELTVRFIIGTHRIRGAKDAMSRHIVAELDRAGIGIASATYDIVGFPAIEVRQASAAKAVQLPDDAPASAGQPASSPQTAGR